ncbi:class II fructose-bisphosphate aldolase [Leadbettera azotonutricia]|uniref:Probable fructose-bisphosphate aldolase 1 n=1 Tax=Leadbettera azotonutricia (strain ATCC BAA-888 / DSM 13862 / ZAS-9) TaxID=545695 RepID=F5YEA6_LEAAZ|nr:class II fructose-bisphosphate aldolase [Leadbettera azotonutricia]AEF81250.1 probable fructose-bisphosphate aldolase 1 [Leadbettera azotonutricia ZAS-9]
MNAKDVILKAREIGTAVPAFNIPYLPMVEPVAAAVKDENIIAIIHVARVEWEKFSSKSLEAVAEEYRKFEKPGFTLLGLDHVPVIDEDQKQVDYLPIIRRAIDAGYQSVMVDASRLDLEGNIEATARVADLVHASGLACEGELGAVMGHESGPIKPYEEIFATKLGFTDINEAIQFAKESRCDWMSVAVGNIHGAVAEATRGQKKPEARLDVDHIAAIYKAVKLPLVLHGGSGIQVDYIRRGIKAGIAKINVGTEIRQAYENGLKNSNNDIGKAQEAVYKRVREVIVDMLGENKTRPALKG